ncbi:L,D-transpeptidase [Methylocapsa acidiphila]|uniref:L,D-transpeptidase n=1 Tax=Methylocapsa acidiphila TaxID=133552 RepID=UPI00041FCE75|nr:L,D-transpeptidase [Methylocapsa acidiphila]
MILLNRRTMVAGASASAAACLAGCVSTDPNPAVTAAAVSVAPAVDAVTPNYNAIYAEVRDGAYAIPAFQYGQVNQAFLRTSVAYATKEAPGTIVVDTGDHLLYHVESGGRATRYGVGVGREGFGWSGEAMIKSKQEWPDWYPPKEMFERQPDLLKHMAELQSGTGMHGGPENPLGARAMYLWQGNRDTLFRIHGTNEPWTIGQSFSSGCIRMVNQDVMDLYQKTSVGARVVVLSYPGSEPAKVAHA